MEVAVGYLKTGSRSEEDSLGESYTSGQRRSRLAESGDFPFVCCAYPGATPPWEPISATLAKGQKWTLRR